MYNHAPQDYVCPICLGLRGRDDPKTLIYPEDLVYQNQDVSAFINSFWIKNNPGHVIVVPNIHYENIFDLPVELGTQIFMLAQKISLLMRKIYPCEGITLLQNNEPSGGQHAFHYHLHIFPRYTSDGLHSHMEDKFLAESSARQSFATKLRDHLK